MPADAEVVTAIFESEGRVLKKIDAIAKEGRADAAGVRKRIDDHERQEAGVLREVTNTLAGIQQEIHDEKEVRQREITRLDGLIVEGANDRRGIWKWILTASGASSIGGGVLAKWFGGGGGP